MSSKFNIIVNVVDEPLFSLPQRKELLLVHAIMTSKLEKEINVVRIMRDMYGHSKHLDLSMTTSEFLRIEKGTERFPRKKLYVRTLHPKL